MSVIQGNDIIALVTGGTLEVFTFPAPPATPIITGTADGGDGSSAVISITGTDTIRLFYRLVYAATWITGLTRLASGDITQTGLSSGRVYEFYCVADDGTVISSPSQVVIQRISGTDARDSALGVSPADILAAYIIDQAIGAMTDPTAGNAWPLYSNYAPDGNGIETNIGSIYDTTGVKDGRRMQGTMTTHYGIQLRIRSDTYVTGYAKAETIAVAMDTIFNAQITINAEDYVLNNISRQGPVISLGVEKGTKGRRLFTINFMATITRII